LDSPFGSTSRNDSRLQAPLGSGSIIPENVQIAIIRTYLEEQIVRAVPLVKHFFDKERPVAEVKADGALVCPSS
jgi:hypothetical protein